MFGHSKGKSVTKKVVLDIETIPDEGAAARAGFQDAEGFPPFPLHELACVSLLIVDQEAMAPPSFSIKTFSREQMSERGIIASVERELSNCFEVITYNGRGFDVPVLMTRVALTGENAPTIARLHTQRRYTPGIHVDLLDVVTAYGAAPKLRLHQLCSAFSIPSKLDVDGGDVATLVASGDWQKVVNYCETDVVATYLALQMWQGAERGGTERAVESWALLAGWIRADQPRLDHLLPYAKPPALLSGGRALGEVK